MPRSTSRGIASGAGASIQSTCPARSAAVRAFGSGRGIVITLSSWGWRASSQWSANGTNSARSRGTSSTSCQGPVPDGVSAYLFQSPPTSANRAGLDIRM